MAKDDLTVSFGIVDNSKKDLNNIKNNFQRTLDSLIKPEMYPKLSKSVLNTFRKDFQRFEDISRSTLDSVQKANERGFIDKKQIISQVGEARAAMVTQLSLLKKDHKNAMGKLKGYNAEIFAYPKTADGIKNSEGYKASVQKVTQLNKEIGQLEQAKNTKTNVLTLFNSLKQKKLKPETKGGFLEFGDYQGVARKFNEAKRQEAVAQSLKDVAAQKEKIKKLDLDYFNTVMRDSEAFYKSQDKQAADKKKDTTGKFNMGVDMSGLGRWNGELKVYKDTLADITRQYGDMYNATEKHNMAMKAAKQHTRNAKMEFQGYLLSIMFAGQAIKTFMMQTWQSSSKTFNEVMHSVEGTTTGFDMLEGSMKYLGFTIGAALEPITQWLVPIIDTVAEWISQHEFLTTVIFGSAFALGAFLAVVGFWGLALFGLIESVIKFNAAWTAFKALLAGSSTYAAIKAFLVTTATSIWGAVTATWAWVSAQFALIAPWVALAAIVLAAIALGISIGFTWRQIVDGWIIKFKLFGNIAKDLFYGIGQWSAEAMSSAIAWVNRLIRAYNIVAEASPILDTISEFDTSAFDNAAATFNQARQGLVSEYVDLLNAGAENERTASDRFNAGWDMIFGAFKSKMGEVSGSTMPSFDIPTPTGADMLSNATATPGQTTVVQIENVNIERTAGESENDYLNRMMKTLADQINRSQNQTGV